MAHTPWCGIGDDKLYVQLGQFTSTLKTSQYVGAVDTGPTGITYDGTNTPWCGTGDDKLYLQSGQFTSTLKTSEYIGDIDISPDGISWDGVNTPWSGTGDAKLYLQSGQFTSTIITSRYVGAIEASPHGISYGSCNTPWCGSGTNKLFLESGQFTSTIKESININAFDSNVKDISFTGVDTLFTGFTSKKMFLQSGQFTSTIKDSQDVSAIDTNPQGICTDDVVSRIGTCPDTYEKSVIDTLTFSQQIVKNFIKQISITDTLILNQQILCSKIIEKSITDTLTFSQEINIIAPIIILSSLTFTQSVSYRKIEYSECIDWSRWIFASATKHFNDMAQINYLPFFIEGTHGKNETQKYIEFRMDGPSITQLNHNYYKLDVEINILWSFNQDHEDFHETERIKGILMCAMRDLCVYRYGNDDSFLGTLKLKQDRKTAVRVNNFGQVRPDVRLMQGTVEGTYVMYLTT